MDKLQRVVTILGCLMVVLTQAGISLYLPSLPAMQHNFHTTHSTIVLSLTAYMAGYAFPMLFWGSLADSIGRKRALFVAILTFSMASVLLAWVKPINIFILLRFFQGAGGGGCAVIGRTMIRDVFEKAALVKAMSYVSIAFVVALGVCQALGGFIQTYLYWQIEFLLMAFIGFSAFAMVAIFLPETSKAEERSHYKIAVICKNYFDIIRDKGFLYVAIGGGVGFGGSMAFNAITPFLFQNKLHLTPAQFGHLGFLLSCSYLLGTFITNRCVERLGMTSVIKIGLFFVISFGIIMTVLGLFNFINLYAILLPFLVIYAGQALIYPCAMAIALKHYKSKAGSATALFGFTQQVLACTSVAIASYLPHDTQLPLAILITLIGITSFIFLAKEIRNKN